MEVQFRFDAVNDYLEDLARTRASSAIIGAFLDANQGELQEIVRRNNRRIFATKGEAINEDWGVYKTTGKGRSGKVRVEGRPVNLVDTGNLLASMVSAELEREGNRLFWQSDVEYAQYVDENYTIYGVDAQALNEISDLFESWFAREGAKVDAPGDDRSIAQRIFDFFSLGRIFGGGR